MYLRAKLTGLVALAAVAVAVPVLAIAKEAPSSDAVVAVVNGDKILKKQVNEAMQQIPQLQGADAATQAAVFPKVLDQIITEKLIDEATQKAKIEQDPEYKKRLDVIKGQLAKQLYVEKMLKDKLTDDVLKSEYEKFKKENAGKQELRIRQILVATEDEAKQVVKDLDAGTRFEELAKKRSSGPSAQNGGEVPGYFAKDEILPEISAAAFTLNVGEYTKTPVKSQFGWHVVKVEDKRDRKVPEFKETEAALRNKLGQEALMKLAQDLRAKADVKLMDAASSTATPEKTEKN